jgi:hypothetical protein
MDASTNTSKRGRKPLTEEQRELRRLEKQNRQKEFYKDNKKYFMMKYNSYLLHENISLEEVEKKLEVSKINYELLSEILEKKRETQN